jgi:hypothetical protein
MTMTPRVRKFALTVHVVSSVGWLGAVSAFLALAINGLTRQDVQTIRAVYPSMELIGWFVIVPCSFAALATGVIQSLGTEWGLFRHYWIVAKLLLTIGATLLLLLHIEPVSRASGLVAGTLLNADFRPLQIRLVIDAGLALLVLLVVTTLSVYKPWGMTPYGRRQLHEQWKGPPSGFASTDREWTTSARWLYVIGVIGIVVLVVLLHLTGRGVRT